MAGLGDFWSPSFPLGYDDYCVGRLPKMDPASCMRLTTVGYVVTPHVHPRLITLTSLVPRRFSATPDTRRWTRGTLQRDILLRARGLGETCG